MVDDFYYIGRADHLQNLMANPFSRGVSTPQQYNTYMNGYNSVNNSNEKKLDLRKILKNGLKDKLRKQD